MPQSITQYGSSHEMPMDARTPIWDKQRQERGFDDTELWSLDITFARFMLPRLQAFRNTPHGIKPEVLDGIIEGFQDIADQECCTSPTSKAERAVELFAKHFFALWY